MGIADALGQLSRAFFHPAPLGRGRVGDPLTLRSFPHAAVSPSWEVGRPAWPRAGYDGRYLEYGRNVVVFACVMARAKAVSQARLRVYRRRAGGDPVEQPDHELRRLISRPNPQTSEARFHLLTALYADVCGFAAIEVVRNGQRYGRRPVELWHLRPDWLKEVKRDNGPSDWRYLVPGRPEVGMPGEDVVIVPGLADLTGAAPGLSPLTVALRQIGIDNAATDFLKLFFDHGGMPRHALVTEQRIDNKSDADLFKERWRQAYGGFENWIGVALLSSGIDVKQIGMDLDAMAYPDLRRLTDAAICAAFGVPPVLIGLPIGLENSPWSNTGDLKRFFYEDTVSHIWDQIDGAFTTTLLAEAANADRYEIEFDTARIPALRDDRESAVRRASLLWTSGLGTINQAQAEIGEDGFGPAGDVLRLDFAATLVRPEDLPLLADKAVAEPEPEPEPDPDPDPDPDAPPDDGEDAADTIAGEPGAARHLPPSALERRDAATNRAARDLLAQQGRAIFAEFFREQGQRLAAEYRRDAQPRAAHRAAPNGADHDPDPEQARALFDIDWSAEFRRLRDRIALYWTRLAEGAYQMAGGQLGRDLVFDPAMPAARDVLRRVDGRARLIHDTTEQAVWRVIDQAAAEDADAAETARRIGDTVSGWGTGARAVSVAQNEAVTAWNLASVSAYLAAGNVIGARLHDNPDHSTDPGSDGLTCAGRNGLVVALDRVPRHIDGEHPNGTLTVTPVKVGMA